MPLQEGDDPVITSYSAFRRTGYVVLFIAYLNSTKPTNKIKFYLDGYLENLFSTSAGKIALIQSLFDRRSLRPSQSQSVLDIPRILHVATRGVLGSTADTAIFSNPVDHCALTSVKMPL